MTVGRHAYEVHALDDALVARWKSTPTAAAVASLRADLVRELQRKQRPLWIIIDAEETEPPPADVRTALQEGGKELFHLASSVDVLILGSGVRAMLMRTVLRGMALITRTSARLHVHEGVEQAVAQRQPGDVLESVLRGAA